MLSRYLSLLILFFIFGFSGDSGNMSFYVASSGNLLLFPECLEQTTSVTSSSLPSGRNTLCTSSRLFVCHQVDMDLPGCLSLSVVFTLFLCIQWQEWWTHLWLKEGFASWIEYLLVDHCFPEFDVWTQFVSTDFASALKLDALNNRY